MAWQWSVSDYTWWGETLSAMSSLNKMRLT